MRGNWILVLAFGLVWNLNGTEALAITNTHSIEGYSNVISVAPQETIAFSVHVPSGRTDYTVEILRFGTSGDGRDAVGQTVAGPFNCTNGTSRDFDEVNAYANGAGWPVSFTLTIPSSSVPGVAPCTGDSLPASPWQSGIYTAKITDGVSSEYFHMTFIVKDSADARKSIALVASTNTWQAYNFWPGQSWGGASIYDGCGSPGRFLVTFLRPNPYATPETHDNVEGCPDRPFYRTEHLVAGELRVAHWLESNGLNYSEARLGSCHGGRRARSGGVQHRHHQHTQRVLVSGNVQRGAAVPCAGRQRHIAVG